MVKANHALSNSAQDVGEKTRRRNDSKHVPRTLIHLYKKVRYAPVNIWNTLPAATLDQPNIAKFKDELDRFY